MGSDNPTSADDDVIPSEVLTASPAVCRAMMRFHRALARRSMAKYDFTSVSRELRAADVWEGAARQKEATNDVQS